MKYIRLIPSLLVFGFFVGANSANAQSFGAFSYPQSEQANQNIAPIYAQPTPQNHVTTIIYDKPISAPHAIVIEPPPPPQIISAPQIVQSPPPALQPMPNIQPTMVEPKIVRAPIGHQIPKQMAMPENKIDAPKLAKAPIAKLPVLGALRNHKVETPPELMTPQELAKRGPVKAIYQDTKSAIIHDAPQALANALPWVEKDRKNQPTEVVLKNVADKLSRANASDPEWINPARGELFELARKLENLPNAPQYKEEYQAREEDNNDPNIRPFKARPVWPSGKRPVEAPIRPTTLTSDGVEYGGRNYRLAQYDEDENHPKINAPSESHEAEKPKAKATGKGKIKRVSHAKAKKSAKLCSCSLRSHK